MSIQTMKSDLLVDLSTEEQQLLSGGENAFIRARGVFRYGEKRYPVRLFGIVRGLPESEERGNGENGVNGGGED